MKMTSPFPMRSRTMAGAPLTVKRVCMRAGSVLGSIDRGFGAVIHTALVGSGKTFSAIRFFSPRSFSGPKLTGDPRIKRPPPRTH